MGIIYRITNELNGKSYVGKTVRSLETRWKYHIADALRGRTDMLISKSIRKYGSENFTVETLGEYDDELLSEAERCWIKELGTYESGYNLTLGGEGTLGFVFSEKSRKKMSEKAKARGISAESIEAMAKANRGRKLTAEQLAPRIGKKRGPYKGWSDEAKQARSILMKENWKRRKGASTVQSFINKISRPVEQLDCDGNVIAFFPSIKAAAAALGVTHTTARGYIIGRIRNPDRVLRYAKD